MSLKFLGTQTLPIPREQVWEYVLHVKKVASCAPGFESLEELAEEHWKSVVGATVGPVKAKFTMDVTRSEMVEPEHMVVKGNGNAPGTTVEVSSDMHLSARSRFDAHGLDCLARCEWHACEGGGQFAQRNSRETHRAVFRLPQEGHASILWQVLNITSLLPAKGGKL
jgi:hypothetical protein